MPERIANGKEKWVDLMHMNIRRTFFVSFGTMRGSFLCAAQPSQPTQAPDHPPYSQSDGQQTHTLLRHRAVSRTIKRPNRIFGFDKRRNYVRCRSK